MHPNIIICIDVVMYIETIDIRTSSRDEMVDVTSQVAQAIRDSGIDEGIVTVYVPHTTAAVTINENADPSVVHDILAGLDKAFPWHQSYYRHTEGNSAAHIKSAIVGSSVRIPFQNGKMLLGTWQGIFFCEFDGPRRRKTIIAIQ